MNSAEAIYLAIRLLERYLLRFIEEELSYADIGVIQTKLFIVDGTHGNPRKDYALFIYCTTDCK